MILSVKLLQEKCIEHRVPLYQFFVATFPYLGSTMNRDDMVHQDESQHLQDLRADIPSLLFLNMDNALQTHQMARTIPSKMP